MSVDNPTTSPFSLSPYETAALPPSVPKSDRLSPSQKKARELWSPTEVIVPATWPWLLRPETNPEKRPNGFVPPKLPRSCILPFSQRKGSIAGTGIGGLTQKLKEARL